MKLNARNSHIPKLASNNLKRDKENELCVPEILFC